MMNKKIRTLRGTANGNEKKIVFNNDLMNVGWRVKSFQVWPNNLDACPYVWAKLWIGNDEGGSISFSDAGDNRSIAWSASSSPAAPTASQWSVLDPNHIITNELSVHSGSGDSLAYLIELEIMSLTDDEQIMAIIKQRSQDDI